MADKKQFQAIVELSGHIDPSLDKSLKESQKKLSGFNKALIAGAAAAAAAFAGVGVKLFQLGDQFDTVGDTIRVGTGATGKALEGLEKDFEKVYASVPTSMDSAAQAIADLNTRLDISGDTLQEVAKASLQLSDTLGAGDLSAIIEETAGAVKAFGVSNEEIVDKMDYAFRVSQSTGMGYAEILKNISENAGVMQSLGLSFEESAALLGKADKAGASYTNVLAGLKKAQQMGVTLNKSAGEVMSAYVDKIKNADDETKALALSTELFGKKAAAEMVTAIRNGVFDIEDFSKALSENGDTIHGLAEEQYPGFAEQMALMKQNLQLSFKTLSQNVVKAVEAALPKIQQTIQKLTPIVNKIGEMAIPLVDKIAGAFDVLVDVIGFTVDHFNLIAPVLFTIAGAMATVKAVKFAKSIIDTAKAAGTMLTALKTLSLAKIKDKIETLELMALYAKDAIVKGASTAATVAQTVATTTWNAVAGLATVATTALGAAFTFLTSPIGLVVLAIAGVIAAGVALYQHWDEVKAFAVSFGEKIGEVFGNIRDGIVGAFQFVRDAVAGAFTALVGIVKAPVNTIIGMVNGIIAKINGVGFKVPDWIPGIGGKGFSINIPEIPMLATGGFTQGLSIAGEAGQEAVIPLTRYRARAVDIWEKTGDILGITAGETTYNGAVQIGNISFNPQINVKNDVKPVDILNEIRGLGSEFTDLILDALQERKAGLYE